MSISKEAIEAGARALFAVENCDRRQMLDVESNWHGRLNDENRQEYRVLATAALTSAAPYIQAAALREFAHALTAMITVYAERTTEYDAGWVAGMTSAIAGLTARADQLEGETE